MPAEIEPKDRVQRELNRIKPGEDAHDKLVREFDHSYEVYRARQLDATKRRKREPWQADLRVPYGMQTIDTALVNMVGGKPRARTRPRSPAHEGTARGMQYALDYHVEKDHVADKQPVFVQQGLIYGLTAAKNHWLYRERKVRQRRWIDNPLTGQPMQLVMDDVIVDRDGPTFEPWDVYDVWWEPNARDVDSASYVVLRSWLTKQELEPLAKREGNEYGVYSNLEELFEAGPEPRPRASAQERIVGGAPENRTDRYEILEVWRNDRIVVVGNRRVVLRDEPNPYWHGKKPIVIAQTRPDLFKLNGIPETELLDHLQQALWTLMNMRTDNLHLTVNRGFTYREAGVTDVKALKVEPRFMWPVQAHDDIQPVTPPPLPREAYEEDQLLLGRMQLVTGINPYISGADTGAIDQNTATGVTALQEVASRLLRFKARMISYAGYQRSFEQWVDLIQQFMDTPIYVREADPNARDRYQWQVLEPQQVIGDFDVGVEGTEESLSRQQERGEAIGLLNAFAPFAQLVNIQPVLDRVAEAYGFDPEKLHVQPQPAAAGQPPAAPGAAPMAPGQQPITPAGPQAAGPDPRLSAMIENQGAIADMNVLSANGG